MSSPLDSADAAQLSSWMSWVVLRPAGPEDRSAVQALAALDDAAPLREPVLLLEEDGHLRAARSLRDGATVSDPSAATAHLLPLLLAHAEPPKPRGRLREFVRRQALLWERTALGSTWGMSGGDALRAIQRR